LIQDAKIEAQDKFINLTIERQFAKLGINKGVSNGIFFPIFDALTLGVLSSFVFFDVPTIENKTLGHL